jgi:hypothetical protein
MAIYDSPERQSTGPALVMPTPANPPVLPSNQTPGMVPIEQNSPSPTIDVIKLKSLGAFLASEFKTYESHRKLAELRWARNLRQFLGEYDPEVKKNLDTNRSQAYPRITRVKCVSMLSRLMNLLFPTTEKNWGLDAPPVPNLAMPDLQRVLQFAQQAAQEKNVPLSDMMIEAAIRAYASEKAQRLELEIDDQLGELGGNKHLSYVHLCRKVLMSGILYGVGVLKGPFVRTQMQRRWLRDVQAGTISPDEFEANRPHFEFVPIWDYYPDMTSKHLYHMDGQFQRKVLNRYQLRELADDGAFFQSVILSYLKRNPKGNWKERTYETDLRTQGVQSNVNILSVPKFEILVWDGIVESRILESAGIQLPNGFSKDMVDASVWMLDNEIIRCDLSPWVELEPDKRVQMYHHFIFEEDDTNLLGNGLPNIMRDSQMAIAAASRMALDNASVVCGPQLEVNLELLEPGQDIKQIQPYKIWYRNGSGAESQYPAVKNIEIAAHISEIKEIIELFQQFADMETFVNPATGGDLQKGPSEPFRTAAGASMLRGDAALPFKDAVRNFDIFTTSIINSLLVFNKHFNENPEAQGDFQVIARGSSSLIAKEVRGIAYDMLAQTLQPEERSYVDWYKFLGDRLKVRDVDITDVLVTKDEAKNIDSANAAKQQQDEEDMRELMKAEVRKLLADATKSLTGADHSTAKAEVEMYNAILAGLESGVTPADVHAAKIGAELPALLARKFRLASGKDKPAKPANGGSE